MLFVVVAFLYLILASRTLRNEQLTLEARQMLFIYRLFGAIGGFIVFGLMFIPFVSQILPMMIVALLPFVPIVFAEIVCQTMKPRFEERREDPNGSL
jgi:archaellum biogenesis protein FlaJ (TadC family)